MPTKINIEASLVTQAKGRLNKVFFKLDVEQRRPDATGLTTPRKAPSSVFGGVSFDTPGDDDEEEDDEGDQASSPPSREVGEHPELVAWFQEPSLEIEINNMEFDLTAYFKGLEVQKRMLLKCKVARMVHAPDASAAENERTFSGATRLISCLRGSLSMDIVEKSIFIFKNRALIFDSIDTTTMGPVDALKAKFGAVKAFSGKVLLEYEARYGCGGSKQRKQQRRETVAKAAAAKVASDDTPEAAPANAAQVVTDLTEGESADEDVEMNEDIRAALESSGDAQEVSEEDWAEAFNEFGGKVDADGLFVPDSVELARLDDYDTLDDPVADYD